MRLTNLFLLLFFCAIITDLKAQSTNTPNIIVIITDDQGYGDFGFTGNHHVRTPFLDNLAKESTRLSNFYVSPVCAPTRSSLMTGRYSLRTGVRDTYNGGATMAASENTIAEILKTKGYKTGIFGKWHLGDSYPSRPIDQGFDESLTHLAGGMGQVGDFTTYFEGDSSYYNPILWHNGEPQAYDGYCSDIFAEEAVHFVESNKDEPFFCYLSFNAPHTPLQVPEKYYNMYKDIDPSSGFAENALPSMNEIDKEAARKVYAMVTNIDDNVGKLIDKLDELKISDNTVVIFMTDNGPQQPRYVDEMRGRKGSVFRGGVRVPFLIRHPLFPKDHEISTHAAHIDILPTIADICEIDLGNSTNRIDGKSLLPILKGQKIAWPDRSFFFYWTRRFPELYKNIAIQNGDHKLVGNASYNANIKDFQLFNVKIDPMEQTNIVNENTDLAEKLKIELDSIYQELILSNNLVNPPLIEIGNRAENPTILNRNDAGGDRGIWAQESIFGKWDVKINEGVYNIKFKFIQALTGKGSMLLEASTIGKRTEVQLENSDIVEMKGIRMPEMTCEIIPTLFINGNRILPFWVEFTRIE